MLCIREGNDKKVMVKYVWEVISWVFGGEYIGILGESLWCASVLQQNLGSFIFVEDIETCLSSKGHTRFYSTKIVYISSISNDIIHLKCNEDKPVIMAVRWE